MSHIEQRDKSKLGQSYLNAEYLREYMAAFLRFFQKQSYLLSLISMMASFHSTLSPHFTYLKTISYYTKGLEHSLPQHTHTCAAYVGLFDLGGAVVAFLVPQNIAAVCRLFSGIVLS